MVLRLARGTDTMSSEHEASTAVDQHAQRARSRAPSWITDELIADTISTWQPYYDFGLAEQDAIEMLVNIGRLFAYVGASHAPTQPEEAQDS